MKHLNALDVICPDDPAARNRRIAAAAARGIEEAMTAGRCDDDLHRWREHLRLMKLIAAGLA